MIEKIRRYIYFSEVGISGFNYQAMKIEDHFLVDFEYI